MPPATPARRRRGETRERILAAARALLAAEGPRGLTYDAVAARLGITKQAVIYWFPTKAHLGAAIALPVLRAEAEAVIAACPYGAGAALMALAEFHLADLARFRMTYLVPQLSGAPGLSATPHAMAEVHRTTGAMYAALAATLPGHTPQATRREAAAWHAAVLGVVMMAALGEAAGDPMKHGARAQVAALAARIADDAAAG